MKHLQHFGLASDPFVKDPLPEFHFESDAASSAERRVVRGCLQHRSLCVLTGGIGLGKSTVLRRVEEQLDEERFETNLLLLLNAKIEGSWLTTRLARMLGVSDPPTELPQLCAEVFERLAAVHEEGRHVVMMVDDAQILARTEALTELRGLLDLEQDGQHLLTVVLAGGPDLERGLMRDPSLAQRVDVSVILAPLDAEGVAAFVAHRVRLAGGDPGLFAPEALAEISRLSEGVPRLVLSLADNALHEAWLLGTAKVGADAVSRAARDLRLALAPFAAAEPMATGAGFASRSSVAGSGPQAARDRTEPEIAPIFEGLEFDSTVILPEAGPPKEDEEELETLLQEEVS